MQRPAVLGSHLPHQSGRIKGLRSEWHEDKA
jgi:hypothetical protein